MNLKTIAAATLLAGTGLITAGALVLTYVAPPALVILNDTGTTSTTAAQNEPAAAPNTSAAPASGENSHPSGGQAKRTEVWTTQSVEEELQKVVEAIAHHNDDYAKNYFPGTTLPDELDIEAGLAALSDDDGPTYRQVAFQNPKIRACLPVENSGTTITATDGNEENEYMLRNEAHPGDMLCMIRSEHNPTVDMSFFHVRITGDNLLSILEWQRQFA